MRLTVIARQRTNLAFCRPNVALCNTRLILFKSRDPGFKAVRNPPPFIPVTVHIGMDLLDGSGGLIILSNGLQLIYSNVQAEFAGLDLPNKLFSKLVTRLCKQAKSVLSSSSAVLYSAPDDY
jgi:hypothetical protein